MRVLEDRILIEIEMVGDEKSSGGIIIPAKTKQKTDRGTVIDLGEGVDKNKIKIGEKVLFDKYTGVKLNIKDVPHVFVRYDDIIGVIEE